MRKYNMLRYSFYLKLLLLFHIICKKAHIAHIGNQYLPLNNIRILISTL